MYIAPDAFTQQSRNDKEQIRYTGFISQEVEAAALSVGYDFSGVSKPSNKDGLYGLRYSGFVVPLVKAMQEQQQNIQKLEKDNAEMKALLLQLRKEIDALKQLGNKNL